jgi:hypothetical protein
VTIVPSLATALLVVLLLAACGGDDGSGTDVKQKTEDSDAGGLAVTTGSRPPTCSPASRMPTSRQS